MRLSCESVAVVVLKIKQRVTRRHRFNYFERYKINTSLLQGHINEKAEVINFNYIPGIAYLYIGVVMVL